MFPHKRLHKVGIVIRVSFGTKVKTRMLFTNCPGSGRSTLSHRAQTQATHVKRTILIPGGVCRHIGTKSRDLNPWSRSVGHGLETKGLEINILLGTSISAAGAKLRPWRLSVEYSVAKGKVSSFKVSIDWSLVAISHNAMKTLFNSVQ